MSRFRLARLGPSIASVACIAWLPAVAGARCPDSGSPDRSVCRPFSTMFMPSVTATAYFPSDTTWIGGGLELVLFTWSESSAGYGPGTGKLRLDVHLLGSPDDGRGKMVMARGGVSVSFEGNASRSWLIPYFGVDAGGLSEGTIGTRAFAGGELGLYLIYTRRLIVDLEGGYLFPFGDVDRLAGPRAQLALSFALW